MLLNILCDAIAFCYGPAAALSTLIDELLKLSGTSFNFDVLATASLQARSRYSIGRTRRVGFRLDSAQRSRGLCRLCPCPAHRSIEKQPLQDCDCRLRRASSRKYRAAVFKPRGALCKSFARRVS